MSGVDRNGKPLLRASQMTTASDTAKALSEVAHGVLVDLAEKLMHVGLSDEYHALSSLRSKLAVLGGDLDTRVRDSFAAARRGEELLK